MTSHQDAAGIELAPVDYDPFAGDTLARTAPTTEAQREVWFADQLEEDASLSYNESMCLSITGALDLAALTAALQQLGARHDMLRTTFSADGMTLMMQDTPRLQPVVADLRQLDSTAQQHARDRLHAEAVTTAFDLTNGPLFRVTLIRFDDARHELILTGHHIVCDGWSFGVLAPELMQLYVDCRDARPPSLPAAPAFADYALRERAPEQVAAAEADCRYWVGLFDASIPVLELPLDRPRPTRRTFASQREDLLLDSALVKSIRQLGARQGVSLFATMFSLFGGLMARLSGSDDVVVGVPAAGQLASDQTGLVGHCVHLLPIRVAAPSCGTIKALIDDARGRVLDAYDHQACTFGSLLKKLQVSRDTSRLPLVSVLFNIDSAIRDDDLSVAGLKVSMRTNPRHYENFELFLNASQIDSGILLELQFNTDLFDQATVRSWLALYRTALERAVAADDMTLAQAFAAGADDLAQLAAWNATSRPYRDTLRVDALIAQQVAVGPQHVAVRCGARTLQYGQLDQRANQLARLLRERGIGRGQLVGLCLERGVDMLVAQLGILKSGAAYVPLDPSYPTERLAWMVADANLAALVTEARHADLLALPRARTILLDDDAALLAAQPDTTPAEDERAARADDVAYVIYTSGSTGKPKGVQVPHRAVVNFLTSMREQPGIASTDRLVAVTTLSFDIAVLELLLPLTVGAEVVLASRDQALDPQALATLLDDSRATMMQATPSSWRMLLDTGWQAPAGFKALIGGEALATDLAARLLACGVELWNMYGPTETTIWSTCWRVDSVANGIRIGRPIANTVIRILDEHGQPCPIGTPGELWIGGAGVAVGYLNQPALTAERFIADPFSDLPGARLYKSGDRARWRSDGLLEHLGRNDFQIKVRGFRIEPGEIEAALAAHPALAESLVIAREDVPGDVRLVAYVVARAEPPDEAALCQHLAATLPAYMVPQHFIALPRLPLLPNGKIDRAALPRPGLAKPAAQAVRMTPQTPLEHQLLALMEQVLNLPGIDVRGNFFALGGHSLLASDLAARIGAALNTRIPLRAIFDAPTVQQLAAWIEQRGKTGISARWAIHRRTERRTAPLSLMQQRLWFLEQIEPDRAIHNTPSAHRLSGKFDEAAFRRAFAEMVRRQDILRTGIEVIDEVVMQVIQPDLTYAIEPIEDLRGIAADERERVLREKLQELADAPLPLTEMPLFRVKLFRTGDDEHVFYFGPHHIIWDGWSFDILSKEMAALYQACRTNGPITLPEPVLSYGDFSAWQRESMQGDEVRDQVEHWKRALANLPDALDLPTDYPRPALLSGQSAVAWLQLAPATLAAAREMARDHGTTLFVSMLAAYVLLVHKITRQSDIVVGMPVRGRQTEEVENVMGMFVNALPLRIAVNPDGDFAELLCTVRDAVIDAFKFPDVPIEQLVRDLKTPRDRSRSPIFQTMFSFQDAQSRALQWGDLAYDMIHLRQPGLAEDITLWFIERPQGVTGCLCYNTDLISATSADLIRDRYGYLFQCAMAAPQTPIWKIALSQSEQAQLAAWNATSRPYPDTLRVDALIAQQVAVGPQRGAVRCGARTLQYGQLDQRANQLARLLRERGIGRGQLVGLCLERGVDMLVAQLGILKSGAAYVPLDPSYPTERLAWMVADANLAALVTEARHADLLALPRARTILLDDDAALLAAQPDTTPAEDERAARADDVAYVIYTSGSTGKPKGVQVPHRAVVNFLTSMREQPGIASTDRLVAVTTLSFDIAVLELLLPLTVGAEVELASRDQALDPQALATLLDDSRATMMQATPSSWRMLLDTGWQAPAGFKALIGGEALATDLAARLLACGVELWNMYGPTETTIWSTCWRVDSVANGIRIGRPIANTVIRILDEHGQPCPIGTPGELWIGGAGVAVGYLNQPALTAERFIADPFSDLPGARLYKSGDRARWRSDGLLEHLGRNDFQIKVRGFRIEPGEIEAALAAHPALAESLVIAREDVPGDVRLVAYVVARAEPPDEAALRQHLAATLPAYMVPQHFIALPRLPLLPNGKIDRAALPRPGLASTDTAARSAAELPLTATEKRLAAIWSELLQTSDIQLKDNFFDLGGHSLLAMQAILAMETQTGKRLNPRRFIFETLRQIARAYDDTEVEAPKAGLFNRLFSGVLGRRDT
ncbi:amino acid adenylation domain-containing protein [Actimicrobium sp. GrIS 1.19]|uniref:non-ribosomal peptide synthetase n=1 Tax=Actimicrobium sp. GrIS 1.19 TaxID=3071708 RepID=UPI002DF90804|nr:non-ribosomal peptide synthetase [Actimicrobium sp. GrIS 1.19]MEC5216191.1 amino acid adenylation domain-containing protein [Actimicrobium sp. GrIS 1.19]